MRLVKSLTLAIASTGVLLLSAATQALALELNFDTQIGQPGFAPGQLAVPQGIEVQKQTGDIFVSNGRGLDRVEVYDSEGNYIKSIGSTGSGPGQFDEPSTLAFDPDNGNLYVGDVFNNRINVFDADGNFLRSFAEGDFGGLKPGRAFFGPSGMTFDKEGNLYVGDFSNDKINVYNKEGKLIKTIGSSGTEPGQFQGPAGVRISPVSGKIYVTDQFNNRVEVLDCEGNPLLVFGEQGTGPGQFNQPIGVEVDEQENIYVADSINSRVQVFDKDGKFLTAYGKPAAAPPPALDQPPFGDPLDLTPGTFNWTAGTLLYNNKLYVGDFFQGRVQVLDINNDQDTAAPADDSASDQ